MNDSFPNFRQSETYDCGLVCIKIISNYYEKNIDLKPYYKNNSEKGFSIFELCEIAEKKGFVSRSYYASIDELKRIKAPVILHWDNNHYVVLYKVSKNKFYLSDPAHGKRVLSKERFSKSFLDLGENLRGKIIRLKPNAEFFEERNKKSNVLSAIDFLYSHLRVYKSSLYNLLVVMVLITLVYASLPFITKSIIDVGVQGRDLNFISVILFANISLLIFRSIGEWIKSSISLHIASRIKISIITDYLSKVLKLPFTHIEGMLQGDIIQRSNDQERIQQFISNSVISVVMGVLLLLVYGIILLIFDSMLFWIFIGGTVLYIWWVSFFFQIRKKMDIKYYELKGENQSSWMEILNNYEDIKLNNYALTKRWKWEKLQNSLFKVGIKLLHVDRTQQLGADFINGFKDIALTFYGAFLVIEGEMTIGTLISIQFIIGQLKSPIIEIINFIKHSQSAYISFLRVNDVYQAENEQEESGVLVENINNDYDNSIYFKNVSFKYRGSKLPTLFNLNFKIEENKVTAIVGVSGSGKSTTLKIINKLYSNYNGDVLIGKVNLKNFNNSFLRRKTGYVLQNSKLYNDTILNNIVMSSQNDYSPGLVDKVLKWVNLNDEITEQYSEGLNAKLKEGGEGLSQGQKQRLILARALYKRPKYLILDEFTNAIDSISEKKIMKLFSKGLKNQTTLIVSHKISTIKHADHVILIDKGRVIEQGGFEELVQKKAFFYNMFKSSLRTEEIEFK